jgi:type IV secretory pathway VirB2 component (pilin)
MRHGVRLAGLFMGLALTVAQTHAEPVQEGYSAAGLYNLANSYVLSGKPGLAVLNYERASLLAPNDDDIKANLRHVREAAHLAPQRRNWFERALPVARPVVALWLAILGVLLAGTALIAGRLSAKFRWARLAAVIVGIALIGFTAGNGIVIWPKLHEGIVITAATPVRVTPVPMGDPLFVLAEGETVKMGAEHEGYVFVQTLAGRTGWVSHGNVAPILPRT